MRSVFITSFFTVLVFFLQAQMDTIESYDCSLTAICELAIKVSPNITAQHLTLERSSYAVDVMRSDFDPVAFSSIDVSRSGLNLNDLDLRKQFVGNMLNTDVYQISGGIQKKFVSGMSVSTGLDFNRISDNIPVNAYNETVGSHVGSNSTSLNVSLLQPLLRGKGRDYNEAPIEIAKIDVATDKFTLEYNSSEQIQNVALGYWQYLGDFQRLKIYETNERRVRNVLDMTQELVNADKKPASDLLQIQADLLDKERQVISARQNLLSSRKNLARYIGLYENESQYIGKPTNGFPDISEHELVDLESLIDIAIAHRKDLDAIYQQKLRSEILVDLAENDMKSDLSVTGTIRYGGTDFGNGLHRIFTPLSTNDGRNYQVGVGLRYNMPIGNNRAEANLLISENNVTNQELIYSNQLRNVEISLSIEYNNLINLIEGAEKAKKTLEYYNQVFDNEQLKFQNGLTTILNLILFQERLTFAQLDYLQNQQQVANTLIRIRHQTGTLVSVENETLNIKNDDIFYQLPIH